MPSSPLVVVLGSSNTDLVVSAPRLPRPGETLLGGTFRRSAGGKGANQAVAAARAGMRVLFAGMRGDDDFGRTARQGLRGEGIDVSAFLVEPGMPSGVALIVIGGRERQNQIVVARSANDAMSAARVEALRPKLSRAAVIVAQLETPLSAVRRAAEIAMEEGIPFLLNPAPARPLPTALLRLVHTLVPNEHEAALLTGRASPEKAAAVLLRRGCRNVVVTLGSRGALLASADGIERLPAPKVAPVDTVGAGDCFVGWLAAGLAEGLDLRAAVARAIRAAALKVTRVGAQEGMPRRGELRSGTG